MSIEPTREPHGKEVDRDLGEEGSSSPPDDLTSGPGDPSVSRDERSSRASRRPAARVVGYAHVGPLPDPNTLAAYDQLVPGAARKIINDHTTQGAHRRSLEAKIVDAGIAHQRLGTICGTILSGMAITGGCVVAVLGAPAAGAVIAGTASVSLATAFIVGQQSQRKEREAKAKIAAKMKQGLTRNESEAGPSAADESLEGQS